MQLANLSPQEKEIIQALNEPKIKDIAIEELIKNMFVLIGKTHLNCGFEVDKNQVGLTIDELCSDLKKYNSTLTFSEIQIAFNNGYKKKYGEFYGLNNATYFGWVNAYTWSESRLKAKKTIENGKKIEEVKLTEQEKEEIVKNGVLKMFEDFKKGLDIFDSGNVVYDYLDKKGHITFTKERKLEIYKSVEERIKNATLMTKERTQSIEKLLLSALEPNKLKSEAKREALKQYFADLVEMNEELNVA